MPDENESTQTRVTIQRLWQAIQQRDWLIVESLYAEAALWEGPGSFKVVGRAAIGLTWRKYVQAQPDLRFVVQELICEGNRAALHYHERTSLKTQPQVARVMSFYKLHDGLISSEFTLFDRKDRPESN